MTVLTLSGSPSPNSRSARLLDHAAAQLRSRGLATRRIAVRELPADALLGARLDDATLAAAIAEVAQAQAIVLATPVYKAAYSGLLKSFLDLLPQDGLSGKLVLPLATGGSQAHLLALDYALRPVLAALGAHHVLGSIYGTDAEIGSTPDGGLKLAAELERRIAEGVAHLDSVLARNAHAARNADVLPHSPRAAIAAARMCCPF
jgi:FMN reductase